MKIIIGQRAAGKTTQALEYLAVQKKAIFITMHHTEELRLQAMLRKEKPKDSRINRIMCPMCYGLGRTTGKDYDKVIIDNAESVMQYFFREYIDRVYLSTSPTFFDSKDLNVRDSD